MKKRKPSWDKPEEEKQTAQPKIIKTEKSKTTPPGKPRTSTASTLSTLAPGTLIGNLPRSPLRGRCIDIANREEKGVTANVAIIPVALLTTDSQVYNLTPTPPSLGSQETTVKTLSQEATQPVEGSQPEVEAIEPTATIGMKPR